MSKSFFRRHHFDSRRKDLESKIDKSKHTNLPSFVFRYFWPKVFASTVFNIILFHIFSDTLEPWHFLFRQSIVKFCGCACARVQNEKPSQLITVQQGQALYNTYHTYYFDFALHSFAGIIILQSLCRLHTEHIRICVNFIFISFRASTRLTCLGVTLSSFFVVVGFFCIVSSHIQFKPLKRHCLVTCNRVGAHIFAVDSPCDWWLGSLCREYVILFDTSETHFNYIFLLMEAGITKYGEGSQQE